MSKRKTDAEKDRLYDLTQDAQARLVELAKNNGTEADVVKMFQEMKATPEQKCSVFWEMDNKPGRWGASYFTWHSLLRRTRNNPVFGRQMFATFREGNQ
jgi:hypothetical protein